MENISRILTSLWFSAIPLPSASRVLGHGSSAQFCAFHPLFRHPSIRKRCEHEYPLSCFLPLSFWSTFLSSFLPWLFCLFFYSLSFLFASSCLFLMCLFLCPLLHCLTVIGTKRESCSIRTVIRHVDSMHDGLKNVRKYEPQ